MDYTGRVRGYGVANLDEALPNYDWRFSLKNVWKVEQLLIDWPHRKIKTSNPPASALCTRDMSHTAKRHGRKPWRYYTGRDAGPVACRVSVKKMCSSQFISSKLDLDVRQDPRDWACPLCPPGRHSPWTCPAFSSSRRSRPGVRPDFSLLDKLRELGVKSATP